MVWLKDHISLFSISTKSTEFFYKCKKDEICKAHCNTYGMLLRRNRHGTEVRHHTAESVQYKFHRRTRTPHQNTTWQLQ